MISTFRIKFKEISNKYDSGVERTVTVKARNEKEARSVFHKEIGSSKSIKVVGVKSGKEANY